MASLSRKMTAAAKKKVETVIHHLHGSFMKSYTDCGIIFVKAVYSFDADKVTCTTCLRAMKKARK